MKTQVKCINTIQYHENVKIGDIGYIDGYVRGGNDVPLVVCVFGDELVLVEFYNLKVIK